MRNRTSCFFGKIYVFVVNHFYSVFERVIYNRKYEFDSFLDALGDEGNDHI